MNVGSPPTVRRTSLSASSRSTCLPSASIADHCASVKGFVTRGSSWMRVTDISNVRTVFETSVMPVTGAALPGSAVQASGMWPSPARSPEVASRPIHPAPGTYASHHACRSVKSFSGPLGPSSDLRSAASWMR